MDRPIQPAAHPDRLANTKRHERRGRCAPRSTTMWQNLENAAEHMSIGKLIGTGLGGATIASAPLAIDPATVTSWLQVAGAALAVLTGLVVLVGTWTIWRLKIRHQRRLMSKDDDLNET